MQVRRLGSHEVSVLGLGCMNLSHAYGSPPPAQAAGALLLHALDRGITHFDTAALYGFGANETLLGRVLKPHRQKIFLASKCGMTGVDGKRVIDGRPETLQRTNLGELQRGSCVNVERSLTLSDRLGGHLVTGHIDALGTLVDVRVDGPWQTMWFEHARELGRQIAAKGSIAVDGVSLTVVDAQPQRFSVALIPYTLAVTTLGAAQLGQRVNLETDLLAKYVARQLELRATP